MKFNQQIPYGNIIYVDGSRTDYYTPDGSQEFPYKTISSAITVGIDKTLYVQPATYSEDISIGSGNIQIIGSTKEQCIINGSITFNQSITDNANIDIINFTIYPTSPSSSTIINFGSPIPTGISYVYNFKNCIIKADSATYYILETTTPYAMNFSFYDCLLENNGSSKLIYSDATVSPSSLYLYNTITNGTVTNDGNTLTYNIDALSTIPTFDGTGISNINYLTEDNHIKNTSTISGTTITDAINNVVPITRTINGHALSNNVSLVADDIATSSTGVSIQDNLNILNFNPQNTVLYVDGNRSDSYVENGTFEKPYKTITSAITASINGNSILILPATYTENLTNNSKTGLNFIGLDKTATIISGSHIFWYGASYQNLTFTSSSTPTIYLLPNSGIQTSVFNNCDILCTYSGTSSTVSISGSSTPNQVVVYFNQCYIFNSASTANPIYGINLPSQTTSTVHNIYFRGTYFGYNTSNVNVASRIIITESNGGFNVYIDAGSYLVQQINDSDTVSYLNSSANQINNDSSITGTSVKDALNNVVPITRTINDINLSDNINLTASDIYTNATGISVQDNLDTLNNISASNIITNITGENVQEALDSKVSTSTTINGYALSSNIDIVASDISTSQTGTDIQEALDSKLASTSPKTNGISIFIPTITAGTTDNVAVIPIPKSFTGSKVRISAVTAPTGSGSISVDIKYHASNPASASTIFTETGTNPIISYNSSPLVDDSGTLGVTSYAADGFLTVSITASAGTGSWVGLGITIVAV